MMLKFEDWRLYENVQIAFIGGEPFDFDQDVAGMPYEEAWKQAWALARTAPINILRNKEINSVAILNGKVVGVLYDSWYQDEYSFDVIVDPKFQQQGIGKKLIDAAMISFHNDSDGRGDHPHIRAEVVNKNLITLLSRLGFKPAGQEGGITFMTYGDVPEEEEL